MVRSSTLTEEPLVRDIDHTDTVCTVGVTNFFARLNPAGMALIKSIDPEAIFIERYTHELWSISSLHHSRVNKDALRDVDGFARLYEWIVDVDDVALYAKTKLLTGFPYEIDVKESSPLVGWFNVMKGVSNG